MRKNFKLLGAVAVAGLVATTGSAFTASNTVEDSIAGYGTSTISGATATAVVHTLSANGGTIDATEITFGVAQTGRTVVAGFGSTALEDCVVNATDGLSAVCTYTTGYDTVTATAFNVAVS